MTNIVLRLMVENPTDKINEETIKPLIRHIRGELKVFMKNNLPENTVIKVKRITKAQKERRTKTINCMVCHLDFKTIIAERKLCSNCIKVSRGAYTIPARYDST